MADDLDPELRAEIDRRVAAGEVTRYPTGASSPEGEIRTHPFRNYKFGKAIAAARNRAAQENADEKKSRLVHSHASIDGVFDGWDRRSEPAVDVAMRNGLVPLDGADV